MQLRQLVETATAIGATPKRSVKTRALADLLTRIRDNAEGHDEFNRYREAHLCALYLSGQVRQPRLGVGYSTVAKLASQPPAPLASLTVVAVDDLLERVATTTGSGSTKHRLELLTQLFTSATEPEQRFLRGLLLGELRQGALEGLMMDAIGIASEVQSTELRRAILVRGDFAQVAATALVQGAAGLTEFRLTLFQPLSPMLAQPADEVHAALAAGPMRAEFKLDGARIQVHKRGAEVRVYSRQLNDVTEAVPEVVSLVASFPKEQLILDGEALAMRPNGKPFPFQDTMRRFGRKQASIEDQRRLPLVCFFFDCLHWDGEDVFDRPSSERTQLLENLPAAHLITSQQVTTTEEVDAMFSAALSAGHEGLVLKAPNSEYEPGRRGSSWLKLKPVHTLDLVVLAAEWGSGRRHGTLSNLHLGARSSEGFVMLGKTFKGLTDELLAYQTKELLARETRREGHIVHVAPSLVVEIAFAGVQRSSQYPGGVALRFARVKRYRPDKLPSEADTLEQVLAFAPAPVD
jgi:DNA ligase 1